MILTCKALHLQWAQSSEFQLHKVHQVTWEPTRGKNRTRSWGFLVISLFSNRSALKWKLIQIMIYFPTRGPSDMPCTFGPNVLISRHADCTIYLSWPCIHHPASHIKLWTSGGKFASGSNFKGGAFFSSGGRFFFLRGALFFPMKNAQIKKGGLRPPWICFAAASYQHTCAIVIVEGVALNCKANAHFIARKSVAFSCVFLSARLAQIRAYVRMSPP